MKYKTTIYITLAVLGLTALSLASCRSTKAAEDKQPTAKEDITVKTVYKTLYKDTTIYLEIPAQSEAKTVKDTASRLENDFAVSEARINSDGSLYHALKTKPQKRAQNVKLPYTEVRKDSVKEKETPVRVEVEKELTAWQRISIDWFTPLLIAFACVILYYIIKLVKKLKSIL